MMVSNAIEYHQRSPIIVDRIIPDGRKLILLGDSEKGVEFSPVQIMHEQMALREFGEGELLNRYRDVLSATNQVEVYFMKVPSRNFQSAFKCLQAFDFDLIYIDDFNFGNSIDDIQSFIDLSEDKQDQGRLIHGIFDLPVMSDFNEYYQIFDLIHNFSHRSIADVVEKGKYFSLVANHLKKKAGAVYAGLLASLDPHVNPVNKQVNVELEATFTKEQIHTLKEQGVVCFKNSYHKGTVCASATCAVSTFGSVHKSVSNYRIVQYIIAQFSSQASFFIGQTGTDFHAFEIKKILLEILMDCVIEGMIKEYDFSLDIDKAKGYIYVNIEVVPIFSVERITTNSQVKIYK